MNYSTNILDIITTKTVTQIAKTKSLSDLISNATSWMNDFYPKIPTKIRILAIKNDYTESSFPRCPICNKPVGYDKEYHDSFMQFCSNACSQKRKRLDDEIELKLSDRNWLYQKRIEEKLSYDSIGKLLGTSHNPVKKACLGFGIPEIKYNESDATVAVKLYDKEFLHHQYHVVGLDTQEIANLIGSSQATVCRVMNDLGIQMKPVNSYPRKFAKRSKQEIALEEFIQSLGIKTSNSNRNILDGLEIDILCPDQKIGFEYNGMYSHNDDNKDKNYHLTKTKLAAEKGIQLFHIFEDSWVLDTEVVKSVVAAKLGVFNRTIYARKCIVREISTQEKSSFLSKCHLQGDDKSTIKLGLFHQDELVSVMTFSKSRYSKNYDWELVRFANSLNTRVIGGFSKLLKSFRMKYSGSIVSYADMTYSDGGVYAKNGFYLVRTNPPSYKYIEKNKLRRLHRSNFIKSIISSSDDPRSESEIMKDLGYTRIWDCGTKTYTLDK